MKDERIGAPKGTSRHWLVVGLLGLSLIFCGCLYASFKVPIAVEAKRFYNVNNEVKRIKLYRNFWHKPMYLEIWSKHSPTEQHSLSCLDVNCVAVQDGAPFRGTDHPLVLAIISSDWDKDIKYVRVRRYHWIKPDKEELIVLSNN